MSWTISAFPGASLQSLTARYLQALHSKYPQLLERVRKEAVRLLSLGLEKASLYEKMEREKRDRLSEELAASVSAAKFQPARSMPSPSPRPL